MLGVVHLKSLYPFIIKVTAGISKQSIRTSYNNIHVRRCSPKIVLSLRCPFLTIKVTYIIFLIFALKLHTFPLYMLHNKSICRVGTVNPSNKIKDERCGKSQAWVNKKRKKT